jgi:MFS family permease
MRVPATHEAINVHDNYFRTALWQTVATVQSDRILQSVVHDWRHAHRSDRMAGPSWDIVLTGGSMAVVTLVVSMMSGYFLAGAVAGAIMGAIGTRVRRSHFVLQGLIAGAISSLGVGFLWRVLLHGHGLSYIDVLAAFDASVASSVMSYWLHRRIARSEQVRLPADLTREPAVQ